MTATPTPARSPSRVSAVILGDPWGHRPEIVAALERFGFRHSFADTPGSALRQAQNSSSTVLVVAARDVAEEPELAGNPAGRRTIVIAGPGDNRDAIPQSIAAILDAEEAGSVDALAETLQSVAREVSYSRRRDTMLRWLERESERDAATGLRTRQAFEDQLEAICAATSGRGESVCTIVVDVPSTRAVQEAYGSDVTNELLYRAAQAVIRSIRISDVAGRLSLDTFGIALPGASLDTGRRIARRILQTVEQQNASTDIDLGISLGFGVAAGTGCTAAELLEAATRQVAHAHRGYAQARPRVTDSEGPSVA